MCYGFKGFFSGGEGLLLRDAIYHEGTLPRMSTQLTFAQSSLYLECGAWNL